MKTVIQIFIDKNIRYCNDKDASSGIGDLLRSTLGLYNLSKEMNFNVIVDFSLHPISKLLIGSKHAYSHLINQNNIPIIKGKQVVQDYINSNPGEIIILYAWFYLEVYDTPISQDAQDFMKNILRPNTLLQCHINEKMQQIPFPEYNIIHYRMGDDDIINNNKFSYNLTHIQSNYETCDILLSDSSGYKEQVQNKNSNIFMFNDTICHLGFCNDDNSVKNTLFEFFLVARAQKIKSYSIYPWTSGFTKAMSVIYDIPIVSEINMILK
jgi:hypothetical protein